MSARRPSSPIGPARHMPTRRRALLLAVLALTGCAVPVAPTRYYTLAGGEPVRVESGVSRWRVAVGPVTVPETIDRPQLVLRRDAQRYRIDDAARWAEPLKTELPRRLAAALADALPQAHVVAAVQYLGRDAGVTVLVDVLALDLTPGTGVHLVADWSIRAADGHELGIGRTVHDEPVGSPDVATLVAGVTPAIAALARPIATALRAARPPSGG